jgi:vacuolar protein sorting-associated protein 45
VLSTSSDPFYAQNIFSNFGDLGAALATYVSDYQTKNTKIGPTSANRIETVADMKRFVEEYPEFRRLGGNVTKHVTLVGELSRLVERDDMLSVSEVEQSLASQESHQADLKVRPCLGIGADG